MKILIVDDSAFMRTILKDLMKKAYPDAEILEAADGNEAITQYRSKRPELLLLDLIMPEKDGMEVLKEIGQESCKKIVVVSSVGQETMIEEARKLGADAYVVKPFDEKELSTTVKDVLGA
ncbi:MAG: response regulator [Candidatus Peregrinibacteria bacterium]